MDEVVPATHMRALWEISNTRGSSKNKKDTQGPAVSMPTKDRYEVFEYGSHGKLPINLNQQRMYDKFPLN